MRRKQLGWLLVINLVSSVGYGQENLIPHPSFEPLDSCDQTFTTIDEKNIGWKSYLIGTPDLWSCYYKAIQGNPTPHHPPNIFAGFQYPFEGCSFAGFGTWIYTGTSGLAIKENFGIRLKTPLEYGVEYCFTGFFSRGDIKRSKCNFLHFTFLQNELEKSDFTFNTNEYITANIEPSIIVESNYIDTTLWREVSFTYKAIGGEQYIYLGQIWTELEDIPVCTEDLGAQNGERYEEYFYVDFLSLYTCDLPSIELPNIFTPNNDSKNDHYLPFYKGEFEWVEFQVFNRWGQVVFQTYDRGVGWNGLNMENGLLCPEGVYFAQVNYRTSSKGILSVNEYFHLVR